MIVAGATLKTVAMSNQSETITKIAIEMTTGSTPAIKSQVMIKKTIAEGGANSKEVRQVTALQRKIASKIRALAKTLAGRTTEISIGAEMEETRAHMGVPQRRGILTRETHNREKAT